MAFGEERREGGEGGAICCKFLAVVLVRVVGSNCFFAPTICLPEEEKNRRLSY